MKKIKMPSVKVPSPKKKLAAKISKSKMKGKSC